MSGEDQERFEDYLELERYIEELQQGQAAHPPKEMTSAQARLYQMAALFRSLPPDAAEPRPEFAEQLKARLIAMQESAEVTDTLPAAPLMSVQETHKEPSAVPAQQTPPSVRAVAQGPQIRRVSRRSLLTGGAVAAASLAIGAGTEHLLEKVNATPRVQSSTDATPASTAPLYDEMAIMPGIATTWQLVATLEQLGTGAVRFVTDSVVGYVIQTVDHYNAPQIVALSAACTHKGCIVQWQESDRLFHCPCHSGLFDEGGSFVNLPGHTRYLSPLPRLNVKIEQDKVYVEVPQSKPL